MEWKVPTFDRDDWELQARETCYRGFFRIDRLTLRYRLFAGGWSGAVTRELFRRGPAVGVLLYDAAADRVALLEQFRIGALADAQSPWLLEIVAGMMNEGETPEEVARRETAEEAGLSDVDLRPIGRFLLSPGGSDETIELFCGLADLSEAHGIHGLDHEAEDIRLFTLPCAEAFEAVHTGRCTNAPAVIALQWLQINRDSLRGPGVQSTPGED